MSYCFKCLKSIDNTNKYGLHPWCFEEWFGCPAKTEFEGLTPQNTESPGGRHTSSFLHGKFRKYTATLGEKRYVLKVIQDEYPNLPRVEYVCNQIARTLKLDVAEFYFIQLESQDCFVSRNFIHGTNWQKLTHIWQYLSDADAFDVETLSRVIFDVTKKPQDVEKLYQVVLFDVLIGNHDRHGRNLAILSKGKTHRLSPIYDNPSYVGIESLLGADLNPTGSIKTKMSDEPTMKDYVAELRRIKAGKAITDFAKRCSLQKIMAVVEAGLLAERVEKAMVRLITKRHGEFYGAL